MKTSIRNDETQFVEVPAHAISKITRSSCRGITGLVVLCDVTDKESIENTSRWKSAVDQATSFYTSLPSILVGTKADLLKDVHEGFTVGADIQRIAKGSGFDRWFVSSADNKENVAEVMGALETLMAKSNRQTCDFVLAAVAKARRKQKGTTELISTEDVTELKHGSAFMKFGRRGKAQLRILWITEDGNSLCWGQYKGKCSNKFALSDISGVIQGQRTPSFRKHATGEFKETSAKQRSMSLLLSGDKKRASIDLIATTDRIFDVWLRFFQHAVERRDAA